MGKVIATFCSDKNLSDQNPLGPGIRSFEKFVSWVKTVVSNFVSGQKYTGLYCHLAKCLQF